MRTINLAGRQARDEPQPIPRPADPPTRVGMLSRNALRSLGRGDRTQQCRPDALGHTAVTRGLQAAIREHEVAADHWAARQTRQLEIERAVLIERLSRTSAPPSSSVPPEPPANADARTRALWASDRRQELTKNRAAEQNSTSRANARTRLAEISAQIEQTQRDARHLKAKWREYYDQEVAIYTRARTGKADPRPDLPVYMAVGSESDDLFSLLTTAPTVPAPRGA